MRHAFVFRVANVDRPSVRVVLISLCQVAQFEFLCQICSALVPAVAGFTAVTVLQNKIIAKGIRMEETREFMHDCNPTFSNKSSHITQISIHIICKCQNKIRKKHAEQNHEYEQRQASVSTYAPSSQAKMQPCRSRMETQILCPPADVFQIPEKFLILPWTKIQTKIQIHERERCYLHTLERFQLRKTYTIQRWKYTQAPNPINNITHFEMHFHAISHGIRQLRLCLDRYCRHWKWLSALGCTKTAT